jgi:murein DD-endopeptidase MepM/ murein hydrolase activator NlpD
VKPETDQIAEGPESIRFRLTAGTGYRTHRDTATALLTLEDLPRDAWRFEKFGNDANTASIAGDAADPDTDGRTNAVEYLAGTEPRDAASFLSSSVSRSVTGAARIRFTAQPGKSYSVQFKNNLSDPVWRKLSDFPAFAERQEVEALDTSAGAAATRFYRVVTPAVE